MAFASATLLGKKGSYKYIRVPCIDCGKERWVALNHGEPKSTRCLSCANRIGHNFPMERNSNWRGGRRDQVDGYVVRTIPQNHPYHSMAGKSNQVREHRLVMAEHLERPLKTEEFVHHLNGLRNDNRIENLVLTDIKEHEKHTLLRALQERIRILEEEIDFFRQSK